MESYQSDQEYMIMVPLEQIALGKIIINKLLISNIKISDIIKEDLSAPNFGKLQRLHNFNNLNDSYPPVKLKAIIGLGLYRIVDGRHRITMSYIRGYTHVPAIIIDLNT